MGLWLRGQIQIIFVVYIACLLVVPTGSKGKITGRATCDSSGLWEPARVTCHYRENVVEVDYVSAVSLLLYAGGKEEHVVECSRLFNNEFDCLMEAGYKLNGAISDQMIINIPSARPEQQGTYYCELKIQETVFQMESCDMEYKEPDDATKSTPPSEQDSDDKLKGDTGTSNATSALIIAGIALFLVLLVIAVLMFRYVRRKLKHRRNRLSRVSVKYTRGYNLSPNQNTVDSDHRYKKDVSQPSDNNTGVNLTGGEWIFKNVNASPDSSNQGSAIGTSSGTGGLLNNGELVRRDSLRQQPCTSKANSAVGNNPFHAEHNAQSGEDGTHGVTRRQKNDERDHLGDDWNSEIVNRIANYSESVNEVSAAAEQNTSGAYSFEGTKPYCEENHELLGDQSTHGVTVSGD